MHELAEQAKICHNPTMRKEQDPTKILQQEIIGKLESLIKAKLATGDALAEEKTDIVFKSSDPSLAPHQALRYIEVDPYLLFGMQVVEKALKDDLHDVAGDPEKAHDLIQQVLRRVKEGSTPQQDQ